VAGELDTIVLSVGYWAEYPCDDRMLRVFLLSLVVLVVGTVIAVLLGNLKVAIQFPNVPHDPVDRQVNAVLLAFMAVVLVLFALVVTLTRTETSLIVTRTSIIETGCQLRKPYTEVYDRSRLTIEYQFRRGSKSSFDRLYVKQKGMRRIKIYLNSGSDWKNLVAIAPAAMREYANQLRAEDRPLPVELKRL